ncbi:MAG: glucose-6-phosphate isomerase, partial [Actinomycetota bacterium]
KETSETQLHSILVAHALAQGSVLSMGRSRDDIHDGTPDLVPHRVIAGNTPVTMLMTRALTPYSLGALISLYEHMVFVQGAVWGINSFDQWGVEYGKVVAQGIESDIDARIWDDSELDEPTRQSLRLYLELRAKD